MGLLGYGPLPGPRRSKRAGTLLATVGPKLTIIIRWSGYLDNSVGGGTPSGMGTFESLVKESMEEASLEEDVVRKHVRAVGVVSYFYRTDAGWLQPEVE